MDEQRQFLGVWIPAELWLDGELSILEKVIYTEIESLDNENHCVASNQYFAEFCKVSESAVSRSIKHLKELGMIEEVGFNGRIRQLSIGKKPKHPRQKAKAPSAKSRSINITNNITNKKDISIINNTNNKKSLVKKSKKSLYEKMQDEIYLFTKNIKLQNALRQFLDLQLEIYREQGKTYYSNIFKSKLNKLKSDFDEEDWLKTVQYATEKGWQNFYPIKDYDKTNKRRTRKCDEGLSCEQYTDEEWEENEKWQKEQIAKGEQITF